MKFTAIEMQGFKSFPEKTKLTFEGGITSIVGPNGSGKSNISDAIRWVLGEMSAKSLRGSKMEDVIFNGTALRPAANYACVSIYIDTSEEYAAKNGIEHADEKPDEPELAPKIRLSDEEQFVVTRKFYRTGDSEYYINKKQVRLKDVNELFYDTGIGREGYSVIGQGKIAEVLSVKGDERRSIFEEASGISKYRVKKNESERKLEATELNLSRVTDILSEVEGRVEPLRIEAEKAKKFIVLDDERTKLEISISLDKADALRDALSDGEKMLASTKLELELAADELSALEKEDEDFEKEGYALMGRNSDLKQAVSDTASEIAELGHQNRLTENNAAHFEERIEAGKREEAVVTARKNSEIAQREAVKRDYDTIIASANALKSEGAALEKKRDEILAPGKSAKEEAEALAIESEECTEKYSALTNEASSYRALIAASGKRDSSAVANIEKSRARLAELGGRKAELEKKDAEFTEDINEIKEKLAVIAAETSEFETKRDDMQKKVSALRVKSAAAEQERESLKRLEGLFEGYSDAVKTVMKSASDGRIKSNGKPVNIRGTVSSLLHTEGEYVVAIETALGASVQYIVSETEEDAKAAIRYLKTIGGGRITVLPLDTVKGRKCDVSRIKDCDGYVGIASELITCEKEYVPIADELLGRTVIAEDLDKASVIARKCGFTVRIVTIDGQIINAGGSFTGGSSQKKVGIFTRNSDIEKLDAEIVAINTELTEAEIELRTAVRGIASRKDSAASLNEELDEISSEYEKIRSSLSEATAIYCEEETNYGNLTAERNMSESEKAELSAKLEECEKTAEALKKRKEECELLIKEANERLARITAGAEEIKERLGQIGMELVSYNTKAEALSDKLGEIDARIAEDDEKLSEIAEERKESEKLIREGDESIEANNKKIEELRAKIVSFEKEIAQIEERLGAREVERPERKQRLKSAQIRREQAFESFTKFETGQENAQKEYDAIIKFLWEEKELTYSTADEQYRLPAEERNNMEIRLASVKRKIASIGSVNTNAVVEYDELKVRYEFLKGQTEDLNRTIRKLNTEILRLSAKMEEIFLATFTAINEKFSVVFAELFGGGSARLELSDPEHPLDCGIDIILHPPGKSVKSITLLSGGEQSFAAIALYLALQEINPSPFCVFDEIEAALDEVNQTKLMDYIKAHCGTTQYILITHRRSTMERSDVLYGITMHEKGVSEFLRLNLHTMGDKIKEYTDQKQ